jgi:hypothetical protein
MIELKAYLAANGCSSVTFPNYAPPVQPAGNASQMVKDMYIIDYKKNEKVIEKSFGLIISTLWKMPTLRDNILTHPTVIAGGANGHIVFTRLLAEIAAGPSADSLAQRVENEIRVVRVKKGEDARIAIENLDRLYSRLSGDYAHSNFKKIQRLIELIPLETTFIEILKSNDKNYMQICSEVNSKQHSARTREEATAIANTVQLESILKNKDENKNAEEGVNFAQSNYSRKSDRRGGSGDEGGEDSGYESASGHQFKKQSRHFELNKKGFNRNVEHYSTGKNMERNGFPATSSHQQSSGKISGNNFPNNNYYGSSGSNSNNNSNFRSDNRRPRDMSSTQCYSCREFGHISTFCPKNKK